MIAGELFSGFGGLTRGIEMAGFTTILAANHNPYKVEVHEANHPDVYCTDWVRVDGEFNPCGVRKIRTWSPCPNRDNHVNRIVKASTLDEIRTGDRIEFYHRSSNRDQWAEVLEWTPAEVIERTGQVSAWDAVLLVDNLDLGNGFSAGRKCVRQRIERWRTESVRFAYTPGVYQD